MVRHGSARRAAVALSALTVSAALAAPALRAAAQPAAPEVLTPIEYDWCSKIVVRPDQRLREDCSPVWKPEEIAAGAEVVLLGRGNDVTDPVLKVSPDACGHVSTHRHNSLYIEKLRRLSKPGSPTTAYIHMHRFELVTRHLAALPGFDAAFLLSTRRPFDEVTGFFDSDRSPDCRAEGCRWSDDWGARDDGQPQLRDLIDAHGAPGRHRSAVYYLNKAGPGVRVFWPVAVVADLTNPGYRAWRVAEAKRAMAAGGYTAIMLNHKLAQYSEPMPFIGRPETPDVTTFNERQNAAFTAPFDDYGYPQYVAGWASLARDLRAAGVPYAVALVGPRIAETADDPSTPYMNEGKLIRETARHARVVLLGKVKSPSAQAEMPATIADLGELGARVIPFELGCGYKR